MNYLIVGGTSGIGKTITEQLIEEDHKIYILARNEKNIPDGATFLKGDVLNLKDEDLESLPDELNGVVYCPGSINLKPFQRLTEEDFKKDFDINVIGAVNVLNKLYIKLKKSEHASVVLFSTVAVTAGLPFHASVSASKAAVEGLGRTLAAEWASYKVRVNIVAPSLTETPMAEHLLSSDDKKESANKRHPIGRYGHPEDIANATTFLLSEKSSWMTGQVLHVDGGLSNLRT